MSLTIRVRNEQHVWKAVWQHLQAHVQRISEQRDTDQEHALNVACVLPVVKVLEDERKRNTGVGLEEALKAMPIDPDHPITGGGYSGAQVQPLGKHRIPGNEEADFAVAWFSFDSDGNLKDDTVELVPTQFLFDEWDDTQKKFIPVALPEYDFGVLIDTTPKFNLKNKVFSLGVPVQTDVMNLFELDDRANAANGNSFNIHDWSELRAARADPSQLPLPKNPKTLTNAEQAQKLNDEAQALDACKSALNDQGVSLPSLDSVSSAMRVCAQAYKNQGQTPLPIAIINVAAAVAQLESDVKGAIDPEMKARIQYPDGTLRQLRMMEQSLAMFWPIRLQWLNWRRPWLNTVLFEEFLYTFAKDCHRLMHGQSTSFSAPNALEVSQPTAMGATTMSVERTDGQPFVPENELTNLLPGQIAIIHGQRPTAMVVLGFGYGPPILEKGKKAKRNPRLKISSLLVSIAATPGLKGTPGLIADGTSINANTPSSLITQNDLKVGDNPTHLEAAGLTNEAIALSSRLQLMLPLGWRQSKFADALVPPAPYPDADPSTGVTLKVQGPVQTTDTNLIVLDAPGITDPKNPPVARPGEFLLIRGADEDGQYWQGVVEVSQVTVQKKKDVAAGQNSGTPPPADQDPETVDPTCCSPDEIEAVVNLRQVFLDNDLVDDISLRRDFQGFGAPSLVVGQPLPTQIDDQSQIKLPSGKQVFRDPELKAAVKILSDWIMGSM